MSWWQKILETIEVGVELFTPGRGKEGHRRRPFRVTEIHDDKLIIKCGKSFNSLKREGFDAIERALIEGHFERLRISSVRQMEPLPGSADRLIREATGMNLPIGNYVCAILERIGVAQYVMDGGRKCIALPTNHNINHQGNNPNYKLSIIIEKDNFGYYAFCPDLEGCQSQGHNLEEVLANIREAVELYLETMSEEEIKTSLSKEILTTSLEVRVG